MRVFGRLLGLAWDALGVKMASRSDGILDGRRFVFALVIFVSQIRIFTNLRRFGKGFRKVLGVFGEDFGGFRGRFLEVLRNTSLVFGNGSSHAIQNNRAAKIIKREWVALLEAFVASLKAVSLFNLSVF